MKKDHDKIKGFVHSSHFVKSYEYEQNSRINSYADWDKVTVGFQIPNPKHSVKQEFAIENVIVGDEIFTIYKCCSDLIEEIKLSADLLTYEYDWDNFGAKPLDKALYLSAISFLVEYNNYIFKTFGSIISAPEINLCPNGSLDLSWSTENARLLINLKGKDKVIGRFYNYVISPSKGDIVKTEKEGTIDVRSFDESLAVWMKNLK